MTPAAPRCSHAAAFCGLMPPPTCRPLGKAVTAAAAADSLPGPSMMT